MILFEYVLSSKEVHEIWKKTRKKILSNESMGKSGSQKPFIFYRIANIF